MSNLIAALVNKMTLETLIALLFIAGIIAVAYYLRRLIRIQREHEAFLKREYKAINESLTYLQTQVWEFEKKLKKLQDLMTNGQ